MENYKQEYKMVRALKETHILLSVESEKTDVPITQLLRRIVKQALQESKTAAPALSQRMQRAQDVSW